MPRGLRVFFALCCLSDVVAAQAGAFNRAPGEGLAIYASGFTRFGRYVDANGKTHRAPDASKFESSIAIEYGVSDWLTLLARPSLVSLRDETSLAPLLSGGALLGAQAQVWRRDDLAIAVQAAARFARGATGARGNGEEPAGAEFRALAGGNVTLFERRFYVEGQAGFRLREGSRNEIAFDATLIAPLVLQTELHAQVFARFFPAGAGQSAGALHKAGVTLVRAFGAKWRVGLAAQASLYARAARRESGVTVTLWRAF